MIKTCKVCGVEFDGHPAQKYCSTECRDESMRVRVDLTCPQCGKSYQMARWEVKKGHGKFCSRACYTASRIGKERPSTWKRHEKICPVCGKTFVVGGRAGDVNQRVCSDECQRLSRYRRGTQAKEIAVVDAVYLAGIIDGEGSVMIQAKRNTVSIRVSVTNTYKPLIEWIRDITGLGGVYGGRIATERHAKRWDWWCDNEGAESLLRQIQPYMKVKAAQAALAIETQERLRDPALKADQTWQEEYRQRMKFMNRRGPRSQKDSG